MASNPRQKLYQQIRAAIATNAVAEEQELSAELAAAEERFADRVSELEDEGLTTSDAQSVAEAEGF